MFFLLRSDCFNVKVKVCQVSGEEIPCLWVRHELNMCITNTCIDFLSNRKDNMNDFLFVLFLRSKPMKNAVIKSFHSNVRKLVRHAVSFHYNNENTLYVHLCFKK